MEGQQTAIMLVFLAIKMKKKYCSVYQTPLLEDYAVWSDWDHVFAPIYGNLKKFLREVDHTKREAIGAFYPDDLVAMETSTGCLVRVTCRTSMELFLKSAK